MDRKEGAVGNSNAGDDHQEQGWRRREFFSLTGRGLALIPILVELANWGVSYDPELVDNPLWTRKVEQTGPDCTG
jgi:DNA-binding HxlR family transcriptional regulator